MIVFELSRSSSNPQVGGILSLSAWDLSQKHDFDIFYTANIRHQSEKLANMAASELQQFFDWVSQRSIPELVSFNASKKVDYLQKVSERLGVVWPGFKVHEIKEIFPNLPKGELNRSVAYVGLPTNLVFTRGTVESATLFAEIFVRMRDKKIGFYQYHIHPVPNHVLATSPKP